MRGPKTAAVMTGFIENTDQINAGRAILEPLGQGAGVCRAVFQEPERGHDQEMAMALTLTRSREDRHAVPVLD